MSKKMEYNKVIVENDDKNINIEDVYNFACKKHLYQKRDNGSPYIIHPVRVALLVAKFKKSKNIKILVSAALLHDTLEDTYTSLQELYDFFGKNSQVPSLVVELTTAKFVPKLIGKANYLAEKMEVMTSYALVIKLCDRLDNISDLEGCTKKKRDYMLSDTRYIIDYLKMRRSLTKTHLKIIDEIEKVLQKNGY